MEADKLEVGKRYKIYEEFEGVYAGESWGNVLAFRDHNVSEAGKDRVSCFASAIVKVEEVQPAHELWPPQLFEVWESPDGTLYVVREHTSRTEEAVWTQINYGSHDSVIGEDLYADRRTHIDGVGWTPIHTNR